MRSFVVSFFFKQLLLFYPQVKFDYNLHKCSSHQALPKLFKECDFEKNSVPKKIKSLKKNSSLKLKGLKLWYLFCYLIYFYESCLNYISSVKPWGSLVSKGLGRRKSWNVICSLTTRLILLELGMTVACIKLYQSCYRKNIQKELWLVWRLKKTKMKIFRNLFLWNWKKKRALIFGMWHYLVIPTKKKTTSR